jgi:MFS family permease
LLKLNTVLAGAVLANATSGYDGSLLNGLQSLPQWADYFGNPAGYVLGTMTSGITFGTIISMSFISWLCDKFGRRRPIIGGSFVIILGPIICCPKLLPVCCRAFHNWHWFRNCCDSSTVAYF